MKLILSNSTFVVGLASVMHQKGMESPKNKIKKRRNKRYRRSKKKTKETKEVLILDFR